MADRFYFSLGKQKFQRLERPTGSVVPAVCVFVVEGFHIRPTLAPVCAQRYERSCFYGKVSTKRKELLSGITAGNGYFHTLYVLIPVVKGGIV
jgi:hypothetical protein